MKKIIAALLFLSILLSLSACNTDGASSDPYDIFETREIVLGNAVDSVELTTKTGEKITVDHTADFYELFATLGLADEDGKKYSCTAQTQLPDQSKSFINMNIYRFADVRYYDARVKKDGDENVAFGEEYSYVKKLENGKFDQSAFNRYTYQDELAFGGMENGENGYVPYASTAYPILPEAGTELADMQARMHYLKSLLHTLELFKRYEPYEANGSTYDYNEFVTEEYTLYENYIVFKQTAPFLTINAVPGQDGALLYAQFANSDCSITKEVYVNVKTGEVELIKVYGDTLWHVPSNVGRKLEMDMQLYIHDVEVSEAQKKADALIDYVKSNVN